MGPKNKGKFASIKRVHWKKRRKRRCKMADDIDIEEHDVMENPMIKQIFPDLSKIKKEISDYENDIRHELNNIKKSIYSSENELYRNINTNKLVTGKISKTRGTKLNKIISPKLKIKLVSEVKIRLVNIKPELLTSKKFCQSCLILFSNREVFSNHQLLCHNDIDDREDTSRKQIKNCSVEKQKESQVYINNDNLGHHENNSTFVNKINEAEFDATVKINALKDKTNDCKLATACVHCSVIFPSRQSLIDHLYEILIKKNSELKHIQYRNERDVIKKNYELLKSDIKMSIDQAKEDGIQTSDFISKCKFCDLNYSDVLLYNTHLRKYHRNEIIKTPNNELILPPSKYRKISNARTSKSTKETNLPKINNNSKDRINKLLMNVKNEVRIMALKVILFKCVNCELHFLTSDAVKNHSEPMSIITWKCLKCQNTFKQNDKVLHKKQHMCSNYFSVVEVNDGCPGKMYQVSFQKTFINHQFICGSQNSEQSQSPDRLNEQSSIKLRKYTMHYYFCSVCKCYVPSYYVNMEVHRKSNCIRLRKYICEFCGLTFSHKSLIFHKKLHIRYNSKLQDFTFFNLTFSSRSKQIKPKMPDFPKCVSCEIYFIYKYEVLNHVCKKVNSLTCPDCKMIFSESAYTIHEQYHCYKLNENDVQSTNLLASNNIISKLSGVIKDTSCPKYKCGDKIKYLYKCNNCDVSMNVYDEVIEHCHSHTHLNNLEIDKANCKICNLTFISSSFNQHQKLHSVYRKNQLKFLSFDVLNFNSNNDEWLDHLFGSFDKNTRNKIIENSIYKYENRVKMEIIQNGPPALTFFKCDKCKSYVNSSSIYKHLEDCNIDSDIFYGKTGNIPFVNNISEKEHFKLNMSLCRIVTFNRVEDKVFNQNISRMKYYVLYQCRYCHVVLEKKNCLNSHICNSHKCKNCNICGLLIYERDYVRHLYKHKVFNSFNRKVMKVVLIGHKVAKKDESRTNSLISKFSGMVCDYTFYKCVKCDVCIRDQRSTMRHYCLIDAAKSKCPRCGLIFDEGKLKGHLKLHDTDPDISRDTIMIEEFGSNESNIEEFCVSSNVEIESKGHLVNNHVPNPDVDERTNERNDFIPTTVTIVNLYKCYCGLHFINEIEINEHIKKCSGIIKGKQSRQDCFKCGLRFTPNVLFKHLLEHHGGEKKTFKYEIVDYFNPSTSII